MNTVSRLLRMLATLFIDDGALVVSVLAWLLAAVWLLPVLIGPAWRGPLLFVGLAVLLGDSVRRA